MERLNKPFEPITTLIIIYFALVAISIALYALIQIFFKSDTATATGLLGWTATIFATIALLYTFNSWRDQKGSDVLSSISKEIYMDLDKFEDLAKETIDLTCFQFISAVVSEDPLKNFNDKYSYKIDELKEFHKQISRKFEIIKSYKSNDEEFKKLINIFNGTFDSIHKILKDTDIIIISTEMVKEYKIIGTESTKITLDDLLKEYNHFIDTDLKEHLTKYIFCIK